MDNWYWEQAGQKVGPMSQEAIRQMAASGKIAPTDLVWCQGMADWQRADMQSWYAIATGPPLPEALSPAPAQQWGNLFKGEAYVESPPPSLLGWSIFVLLCCCLPGGIIGIIYDSQAKSAFARGHYPEAHSAYETGKNWLIGSAIAGVVLSLILGAMRAIR